MSTESWSKKDFHCFLMIYGGTADYNIDDKEVNKIARKYGSDRFLNMLKIFEGSTEEERLDLIREYKNANYETLEDFQGAVNKLMQVYMADGEFSEEEQQQLSDLISKV